MVYPESYTRTDPVDHLDLLEAESIQIIREVAAEFQNPVMLYSIGKDSSCMVRLAQKCISLPARWRLDHGAYRFPVELWLNKKLKERTAALKPAVDAKRLEPNTVEATC